MCKKDDEDHTVVVCNKCFSNILNPDEERFDYEED